MAASRAGKQVEGPNARELKRALREVADPRIAEHSQRFFKTGKGEYGEGDRFLGIRVPVLRKHARAFQALPLRSVVGLLKSPYHEERLCALLILVRKYERGGSSERAEIFRTYLENTRFVNNWDLVDLSAHPIIGAHLFDGDRRVLYDLAGSENLWERRISIVATYHFIKRDDFVDTLELADILLGDSEDLLHKAVGWMLREVGNRNPAIERSFLRGRYKRMPRTMLRYAIEKFPESERRRYLEGTA